jgi:hypothetical protein
MRDSKRLLIVRCLLALFAFCLLALAWKQILVANGWPEAWGESAGGLLRGIGEAVLIALILEWLVDAPAKHRLVEEVIRQASPQVLARVLARLLPDKMFQYIDEKLLRANLVRRSWNITYRIGVLSDNPEYLKLETVSTYEMANTAASPSTYRAVYEVEQSLCAHVGEAMITEVTVRNLLQEAGHNLVFQYPDPGNRPEDKPAPSGDYTAFSKAFEIPVHSKLSAFQFVFKSTEYFQVGAIIPFFAKYPVELTTLRVEYPKEILKVVVDFPADEHSELLPQEGSAEGRREFVFPLPILPGQGFTVRFPRV